MLNAGSGRVRAPALGAFAASLRIAVPGAPVVTLPLRPEPAVVTLDTRGITLHR